MSFCSKLFIVGLAILSAQPVFASRKLVEAPVRWRMDMFGSDSGADSAVSFAGPDRKLGMCSLRGRIELQNISSVAQPVKIFLKRGVGFEYWSEDGNEFLMTHPLSNSKLDTIFQSKDIPVGSGFTIPKLGDPSGDLLTLFIDLGCKTTNGKDGSCELSYNTPTGTKVVLATIATNTLTSSKLYRDASCSFTFPLVVEIAEDRGALTGSIGLIANRSGGYSHFSSGETVHKLNGGRPF